MKFDLTIRNHPIKEKLPYEPFAGGGGFLISSFK